MSDQVKVEGAAVVEQGESLITEIHRQSWPLYSSKLAKEAEGCSLLDAIYKVQAVKSAGSSQGVTLGRKAHPFNFDIVARFQTVNVHHGRSIHTKVSATIGLGFETKNDRKKKQAKVTGIPLDPSELSPEDDIAKIDTVLNPICEHSWQDTINDVCEDYWQTGNGYLEVVRSSEGGRVIGLHHIPAKEVFVVIEDNRYRRHYSIQGGEDSSGVRSFAKFGDLEDFIRRAEGQSVTFEFSGEVTKDMASEVIHFRRPTSLSRWYGFPDWLSAVASIELVQCVTQHEYDFFLNRGVPEFMLFIIGQSLHPQDKRQIEEAMQSTIGLGNSHKSLLINLKNSAETMKVQLEKLALEGKSDGSQFAGMSESLALQIVSAHGVPPLLAGIQVPGKLGAANEMVQAMQAFQVLVIEPAQRLFMQTLRCTLGVDDSLDLDVGDFTLRTITDAIDVQKADTIARMRQSPQEAAAEGRDLDEGLKKAQAAHLRFRQG